MTSERKGGDVKSGKEFLMNHAVVIEFPQNREEEKKVRKRDRFNAGKSGRVYVRGGQLWVDFHYRGLRVRERSGLKDTPSNRVKLRKQLDLVTAEIDNGVFEFAKRFPHSKQKEKFTQLEGKTYRKSPGEVLFKNYVDGWLKEMEEGMSDGQARDYKSILKNHVIPFFGDLTFAEINAVCVKKFIAKLKSYQSRSGEPLAPKTILNYLIPLRVIFKDAVIEYQWEDLRNPFFGLKLPKPGRKRIQPFDFKEWAILMDHILPWYRPYFEFAVQTGLRPSEQVALKWDAVDSEYIHVELSRVRNREKSDLKTAGSARRIELRSNVLKTLDKQWELTRHFESPYVFLTTKGIPIRQENLGKRWRKAFSNCNVRYRRMYETRHTFASWAMEAGESPEWVARTMGHVDTSMIYRTYGRYIPNLTRQDGSAFEKRISQKFKEVKSEIGTIRHKNRHNLGKSRLFGV